MSKTSKKTDETKIYIGPTINGVINSFDCFTNGLPKLEEPFLDLIVDLKDFEKSKKMIENRQGYLWKKYREIENRRENADV